MKYLRVFDSVSEMETVLANSTINIVGLAYNGSTPVVRVKVVTPPPDPKTIPFYIENPTSSSVTTTISKNDFSAPKLTIEKSADGTTWETAGTTSETALSISIPANSKVYLRCNATRWGTYNYYNQIKVGSSCNVGGNIMSLLYGSNFTGDETSLPSGSTYTFKRLFNNSNMVNAKDLLFPAPTLASSCYNEMFYYCTSLTTAPALPATTLAGHCYNGMFKSCTSLTTAPTLPATTLAQMCYAAMFMGCASLTTAPTLPATTLVQECYDNMFNGCTSLNDVTIYANDISASNCLRNWLQNVAATGTFHNLGSATYSRGDSGIPSNWMIVKS